MTNPPSSAEDPLGQDPNPAADPLSGAVEYPPIEYHPTPPPGYPMPPNYGPTASVPPSFPPPGPFPPAGAYPPPGPYPPPVGYGPPPSAYPYADPSTTSGKAIGALVTSLAGVPLCFCAVPSIVGIVLGIVAMNDIKKTGQQGRGMALAAVIVGAVSLALMVLFWVTGAITDTSTYR